ncbi:SDR family NAD(P)-dependent oxidoreductase [Vibrio paucivorans]
MQKRILITGATDGIGYETAKALVELGHHVIVHGRSQSKLDTVTNQLSVFGKVESVLADLSNLDAVANMAYEVQQRFGTLDVLINNAGVFSTPSPVTPEGLDVRFVVNTIAPYQLTKALLPLIEKDGRVVNLSSAAQAPVNIPALMGEKQLGDGEAYAQSKLALTMWSRWLGEMNKTQGPVIVSVNPKSLLGSKMVKDAYGIAGGDIKLGADILIRAALSEEFSQANGLYFDNDIERFSQPHSDALDDAKVEAVIEALETFNTKMKKC